MPLVHSGELRLVHLCDPTQVLDGGARTIVKFLPAIAADTFRGGTQPIAFEGGWLALIHEVVAPDDYARRVYYHRFVWFDAAWMLRGVSRPFSFQQTRIEFAAGLAWHPDATRAADLLWRRRPRSVDTLINAARLPSAAPFLRDIIEGRGDGPGGAPDMLPAEFDDPELALRGPGAPWVRVAVILNAAS